VSGFRRNAERITAKFDPSDAKLMADLARQVAGLIAERGDRGESGADPVLDRLLPDAYRDSPEDAAEFRRFTETELADDKIAGAISLAEAFDGEDGASSPTSRTVTVRFDLPQAIAALRSLTDIRLVLATSIGINYEGIPTATGEAIAVTYAIYNWLGAVQDSLVRAVDR